MRSSASGEALCAQKADPDDLPEGILEGSWDVEAMIGHIWAVRKLYKGL